MALRRERPVLAALVRQDHRSFRAVSRRNSPLLDLVLPALTRAADHGVLWLALTAALHAAPSRRAQRAGRRGLGSLLVASAVTNQVAKRVVPRTRPDLSTVHIGRRARRVPTSNSFPSGHTASAAAYAVGASLDDSRLAIPVGLLATAVGFSRVYTGVHYPADVLAGAALGASVAALGAVVVPRKAKPAVPAKQAPIWLASRPTGKGVRIVINPHAGNGAAPRLSRELRRELPDAELVVLGPDDDLAEVLRTAAVGAEVLGVAGGDGSVGAAATVALTHGLPLLVVPAGTLNHFARDLGLDEPLDAISALRAGRAIRVDVGRVDGKVFLNTASLGSYPAWVSAREKWQARISKPLASFVAADHVLRAGQMRTAVTMSGRRMTVAALFVGAGRYEPSGSVPTHRTTLDTGVLDIRFLQVHDRRPRLHAVSSVVVRRHGMWSPFGRMERTELTTEVTSATLLARDGEVTTLHGQQVTFTIEPAALTVVR